MPQLPSVSDAELSIVLLGNFNPAIFHPEWFSRQNLLEISDVERAVCNFLAPEVADISFLDFGIQAIMNRIVVKTTDASVVPKIVDLVCALLLKLPHTPVTAVGLNSSFHIPLKDEEEWHLIGNTLAPKDIWRGLYEKPGMTSIGIQSHRDGEYPGLINVLIQPSVKFANSIFVHSNHEYRPESKEESAAETVAFIQALARSAFKESTRVAQNIFENIIWKPS